MIGLGNVSLLDGKKISAIFFSVYGTLEVYLLTLVDWNWIRQFIICSKYQRFLDSWWCCELLLDTVSSYTRESGLPALPEDRTHQDTVRFPWTVPSIIELSLNANGLLSIGTARSERRVKNITQSADFRQLHSERIGTNHSFRLDPYTAYDRDSGNGIGTVSPGSCCVALTLFPPSITPATMR